MERNHFLDQLDYFLDSIKEIIFPIYPVFSENFILLFFRKQSDKQKNIEKRKRKRERLIFHFFVFFCFFIFSQKRTNWINTPIIPKIYTLLSLKKYRILFFSFSKKEKKQNWTFYKFERDLNNYRAINEMLFNSKKFCFLFFEKEKNEKCHCFSNIF